MQVLATIGIAFGVFVLLLMALAPLLVELNDRTPEPEPQAKPVPLAGTRQLAA